MADPALALPIAEPGMRIGLFGGSFNPAHEGHRLVAVQCLHRLALDKVWILVTPGNPLKDHSELAPLDDRLARVGEVMRHPDIAVTGFEAARGFTHTFETVDFLTRTKPGVRFVWIMGADSLMTFDHWDRWQDVANTLPMAIYARPSANFSATESPAAVALERFRLPEESAVSLADRDPPAWVYLHGVMSDASSTAIREARKSSF